VPRFAAEINATERDADLKPAAALLSFTAQLLEPVEREVVLGDLAEANVSTPRSIYQVLDLGIRRHAALWLQWRPWLTGPGLALPGSFLLMGTSLSVSQACLNLAQPGAPMSANLTWLLAQLSLLIGWSWTCGLVVGSLSRRTLWASMALCAWPCFVCVSKFHVGSLSPVCLLWYLIPAGVGVSQGVRATAIRVPIAVGIAAALTVTMLWAGHGATPRWRGLPWWMSDFVMSWPAWCLVARACQMARTNRQRAQHRDVAASADRNG
jgi:hypothetical protein